ncbi:MAG: hypothetical protein AAFR54_00800 [Planctomycetota bacterium]
MNRSTRPELRSADLHRFVLLNTTLERASAAPERARALEGLVGDVATRLDAGPGALLRAFPGLVAERMGGFGWAWNGFYAPENEANPPTSLVLSHACGPPVCSPLEAFGGALSSGMCFDAFHFDQTLVAASVDDWPGYVSCDSASGIGTVSGIVVPVRGPEGRPVAVWDLDATEPVVAVDARVMDVLFSTLGRCVSIRPAHFARG